ncbi:uncharacterized protein G2W53_041808 [Senna tora]|uniref:Uncharacterized protein n=1 Tax=Senna tora TaxID=362788 RepID=A0A834SKJ2_9FABA|nr:uncharacterized protein G2W53_041808 [Senna tora]
MEGIREVEPILVEPHVNVGKDEVVVGTTLQGANEVDKGGPPCEIMGEVDVLEEEYVNSEEDKEGMALKEISNILNSPKGRELLSDGLYRMVGDGKSTMIWRDPWVPGIRAGLQPVTSSGVLNFTCVNELLTADGTRWDEEKLELAFDAETCRKVQCIPLPRMHTTDKWAWKGEASGIFSVKSCYKMAMKELWEGVDMVPNLFCVLPSGFWKSIWQLPLLSRYKVFLWRACLGIIPTIEALNHKGLEIEEKCSLCGIESEDVFHALVDCSRLKQVWDEAKYRFDSRVYHNTLIEWLAVEWLKWNNEQRCHLAIALYHIWDGRNCRKFSQESTNLEGLWSRVERSWDENVVARSLMSNDVDMPYTLRWEKPQHPFVKLNVDAAINNNGEGAIGGVLRNCNGWVIGAFMSSTPALNDVAVIEAMAVGKGVKVARDAGVKELIVECDARLVVDMLNSKCDHTSLLCSSSSQQGENGAMNGEMEADGCSTVAEYISSNSLPLTLTHGARLSLSRTALSVSHGARLSTLTHSTLRLARLSPSHVSHDSPSPSTASLPLPQPPLFLPQAFLHCMSEVVEACE